MLLMSASISFGQTIDHYETMVQPGSPCRYLVPGGPVPSDWMSPGFDDAAWMEGTGGVGYGDDDDNTIIDPAISVYCRYPFTIDSLEVIEKILLDMDFDDGFVAYLNGSEIARFNMGETGSPTTWDQLSDDLHEAVTSGGGSPVRFRIDDENLAVLVKGPNILAIEAHNYGASSSDLTSNPFLHAGISSQQVFFELPPDWFVEPVYFDSTALPLMVINTFGQTIPNEPRITAHMGLIFNGEGEMNSPGDPFNGYDGQISIEIRGESSQYFYDKKSYSIETQTDSGTNNNVPLLGMPAENDWVLYAPFGDKSLLRNVISYRTFEDFGDYAPRTRFIELILNDDYMGVYVLTEKIKVDRNRVDIARITPSDTSALDISGGYILRIDKTTDMQPPQFWESPVNPPYADFSRIIYQYFDPEYDELTTQQSRYIQNWMTTFDQMLSSGDFADEQTGYRQYIDVQSFADMMILNEFNKDVDAYRLSNYFYKQKDNNGGKLVAGPPWDYNLTFGNMDYAGDVKETYNWMYPININPYWYKRLMDDPWFRNLIYCRWDELADSTLNFANLDMMIDTCLNRLGEAVERNYARWPVLNIYVWPNPPELITETYAEQITFLKNWISDRLDWINNRWSGRCITTSDNLPVIPELPEISIYPNPGDFSFTRLSLNLNDPVGRISIYILDAAGRTIDELSIESDGNNQFQVTLPDYSHLSQGLYIVHIQTTDGLNRSLKYLKK